MCFGGNVVRKLSWSVAALMLGSLLTALPPVPARAAPPAARPACPADRPSETAAAAAARACGGRVAVADGRDEFTQVFANPDGSGTIEESLVPERVRSGNGWKPVDTTLRRAADDTVRPGATVFPVTFSGGGDAPLATIAKGGHRLTMDWPGKLPKPTLKGDTATYPNVLPDVDLQVTASAVGFSEVLVVRTPQAAKNPALASVSFGLSTSGVTARPVKGGGAEARDNKGNVVFTSPTPVMWDSTANGAGDGAEVEAPSPKQDRAAVAPREARQAEMPTALAGGKITIKPDQRMLRDSGTRYPVFIDPAWTGLLSGNAFANVMSKLPSSKFYQKLPLTDGNVTGTLGAGRTRDCNYCSQYKVRSYFRMNIASVRKKIISKATLQVEQRWSWTCNPKSSARLWVTGAIGPNTTWNNQPSWDSKQYVTSSAASASHKLGGVHGCSGPGSTEFNVQPIINKAANTGTGASTITFGLKAIDEGTLNQWKRYNHKSLRLAIDFNSPPNTPANRYTDGQGCRTGSTRPYVKTATPFLSVNQSDPDKGDQNLSTDFYWWATGGGLSESQKVTYTGANPVNAAKAVTSGTIRDNTVYQWRARTRDAKGAKSGLSGICEFTADLSAPNAPSKVLSTEYPPDSTTQPASGGVGLPGVFKVTAPTSGADQVLGYTYTLDTGVQASGGTYVSAAAAHTNGIPVTPKKDGVNILKVWSKDRASWYSAQPFTYTFKVRPGSGPASEWQFEQADSAGTTDETGHGNTVTLQGGATLAAGRGKAGTALTLNGTTGYAVSTAAVTNPHPDTGVATPVRTNSTFTAAAWVKLASLSGTAQQVAVSADGTRSAAFSLGYSGADSRWRFTMAGTDADNPSMAQVLSNAAPTTGRWTHLAAVYDVSTRKMTLYVNGVAQTATATLTGGFASTSRFVVGRRMFNGAADGYLNGQVDNVRVYNYPVTVDKLQLLTMPESPAIRFPDGDTVKAGAPIKVELDAGGDTNVSSYKYSVGSALLDRSATPTSAGTATSFPVTTTTPGRQDLFAASVNAAGLRSLVAAASFEATGVAAISGRVFDSESGDFAAGAVVTLMPGGLTASADGEGAFTFPGLVSGTSYTVSASVGGRCGKFAEMTTLVDGDTWIDLPLVQLVDETGYSCTEQTAAFAGADQTVLPLTGDDAVREIALPFAFPFYGDAYRSAWVDTNGLLSFADPAGSHPHVAGRPLVDAAEPNAVIAPFWDNLVVDSAASVRSAVTGAGDTQRAVVEWRNVHRKGDTAQRLTFSVSLAPDGTVTTNYDGLDNTAERGGNAVVGIESPEGGEGLTYSAEAAALADDKAIVFNRPESSGEFDTYALTGTLTAENGQPVAGATVTLDPGGQTATTAANGTYAFAGLVPESYTVVSRQAGRCASKAENQVDLTADTVSNLRLGPDHALMGYACTVGASGFAAGTTTLPLTGDDVETDVTLPFPVQFYGRTQTIATISTNGWVGVGGGYLMPLWSDLVIDGSASVRTATRGAAPNRGFLVEWNNALFNGTGERVSVELEIHEDGRVTFHYGNLTTDLQKGSTSTVGLASLSFKAVQYYSEQEAALTANSSITWTPAGTGAIGGILTEAVSTVPIAGATITLNPGNRTTVTAADGSYQFTGLPVGAYVLMASTGGNRCLGQYASTTVYKTQGDAKADLSLDVGADQFYTCTTETRTFLPANTDEWWTGDDEMVQATAPFPVKLYGESTTTPWVSTNGFITFGPEGATDSATTPVPSGAVDGTANSAVYAFWGDWVVDSSAAMATRIGGTAPNRQWTVEWRNVAWYGNDAVRATFQITFTEAGSISLAYDGISPDNPIEQGAEGTVGIEDPSGTVGFQYLYGADLLRDGLTINFAPKAPAQNSVAGKVTCVDEPVAEATVTVVGRSATTAADGTYQITGVPTKTWTAVATLPGGACAGSSTRTVLVGAAPAAADFAVLPAPDGAAYTVTEAAVPYVPLGDTAHQFTGYNTWEAADLPFPVTLYGRSYTSLRVGTEGTLEFDGAFLYPFRGDWSADDWAGSVRVATRGTAPNRQFVVEWREMRHQADWWGTTHTFQAILDEAGGFSFVHPSNDGTFVKSGGISLIGMQNKADLSTLLYSDRLAALRPGYGLRFTRATP